MSFELKNLSEVDIEKIKRYIEEERKFVEKIISGKIKKEKKELVRTVLFIVESPNKARTIANFFGRPSIRTFGGIQAYEVSIGNRHLIITATKGHLIDLTTDNIGLYGVVVAENGIYPYYNSIKRCLECGYQFTEYQGPERKCPICGSTVVDDAWERIEALQKLAQEVDEIIIGTDPDSEGEFIAYAVYLLLQPYTKKTYRAEFHEVTKYSILHALDNLREIDVNRVKAQMVRRIEDRWLGFSLSEKVQKIFKKNWLSAGRVQTPVLGWIVQRFLEYKNSLSYFIGIKARKINLVLDLDIKDKTKLNEIIRVLQNAKVVIKNKKYFEEELNPLPPYMTSTMLQDASNYLGLGVDMIMQLAQDLFEAGLITYHRTDSVRVSPAGIQVAREYISEKFGEDYFKPRVWGEGGAHECIRPTKPINSETLRNMIESGEMEVFVDISPQHFALYGLIFRRFMQSQMTPVVVKKLKYTIEIPEIEYSKEEVGISDVIKHGWDLIDDYRIRSQKIEDIDSMELSIEKVTYWKAAKVRLYSQSDIINLMREKKIGRPSTYATIVSKILRRGYAIESGKKLVPTKLGVYVYYFLNKKYGKFVSEERTRLLEEKMDMIEEGKVDYMQVLYGLKEETDEILRQIDKEEELQQIINEVNNIFGFGSGKRGEFRKYKKS